MTTQPIGPLTLPESCLCAWCGIPQPGYGANQKTCYLEALQRDADAVVMLHPDGQHEPSLIPDMVKPILAEPTS
jgi:hypothetical protein